MAMERTRVGSEHSLEDVTPTISQTPPNSEEKTINVSQNDRQLESKSPSTIISDMPGTLVEKSLSIEQFSDESLHYAQGLKAVTIITALCLAVFLVALDSTIIATAIPKITDTFHSTHDIAWYGSSYLLTRAALQLMYGHMYSTFSIKYTFLAAIAIFELGSLVCAVAPTSNALIIGRAIAGAGVGGLFTGSLLVVVYSSPSQKRPAIAGIISSMWAIASVAGPLLGGLFTDRVSWRWCFYINLPIGALSIAVIAFVIDSRRDGNPENLSFWQRLMKLDLIGSSILIPATVCLLLPLQWGGSMYAWNNPRIIGLFVAAGCLSIIFVIHQIKLGDKATLPPSLFKNRNTLCAFIFAGLFGGGFYPLIFYLAIYFQSMKGSSALLAGIQILPLSISCTISSVSTGFFISAIGYYTPITLFCMVLFSIGAGLLTTIAVTSSYGILFVYQIIAGLGIGVEFEVGFVVVSTVLLPSEISMAISCVPFMMTIGGAISLSISQALFQHGVVGGIQRNAPQLDVYAFLQNGATEIRSLLALDGQQGALGVVLQAYVDGLRGTFWVSTVCAIAAFLAVCGLEWKSVKKQDNVE